MDTTCFLKLPDNFEELYLEYKNKLAGSHAKPADGPVEVVEQREKVGSDKKQNDTAVFAVPSGTVWNELTVKFKNEQTIEAWKGKRHLGDADFKKMGFGKHKPNQQWQFLQRLAVIYATSPNKESDVPTTIDDLAQSLLKGINALQRQHIQTLKTSLASQLKKAFGIDDDPFEDYDQWRFYKTKFRLLPEPDLRREEPYEADAQMHENIEKVGTDDASFGKREGRYLSDDESLDDSDIRYEDDGHSTENDGF